MQTLLAWLLTAIIFISAYPWAVWLVDDAEDGWLPLLPALALSTGGLALVMFTQSLLGIPFLVGSITLVYLALAIPGWLLWWRSGRTIILPQLPQTRLAWLALILLLLVSGAILLNALYWPFSRDDALAIYHFYGQQMAQSGTLAPLPGLDKLYEAYPILIPLNYTYAYLASGWINEYLARLTPALLSLGCLPAAFVLAKQLHSATAGWMAALLLALTPAFGTWASSGYVDLPMAFFYTLAAIFSWRLWQRDHWQDALLAGLIMGLAAFTKNAALIGIPLLALWLLWGVARNHIRWRNLGLSLLACGLIAAPWYIRNLLQAGLLIPNTAWTDQAQHTLDTLLVFITRPGTYSITGLLIVASVLAAAGMLIRTRFQVASYLLLLLWTLPFFAAWWLFVSYDPRFLLLFLPPLCALAGIWAVIGWQELPAGWRRWLLIPVLLVALLLTAQAVWESVEYKDNILRNPLMDDAAKHEVISRES
ncbi:MAG: glycosyltransferase family 39 protein [Anaerolineae bacterium]|nr:glycosyltransferase family 39 protein [Anaerolineae bacterium]